MFISQLEALESRVLLSVDVLMAHYNMAQTSANLDETVLTPANVTSSNFGKLYSQNVDGQVYAQPLVATGVLVGKKQVLHDIVIVATEHDSVYAFDANDSKRGNAAPLWHTSFLRKGVTTVPGFSDDINPEIGITGTPVINKATNTLYVVATTRTGKRGAHAYQQQIHALDLGTGKEKIAPALILPTLPGKGDGSIGRDITFDAFTENQRAGLLLLNGVIYVTWASHGDIPPYHGWIVGYSAATLAQVDVFNDTADGKDGGIWMTGASISVDNEGFLYAAVGNGTFDANAGGPDYGSSIIKLSTRRGLHVVDYFAPSNQASLRKKDLDTGVGAVVILPDQTGAHKHLAITPSKAGVVFVLDRDDLGGFNANKDDIVQEYPGDKAFSSPAYFNGHLFQVTQHVEAYTVNGNGLGTPTPSKQLFGFPGATPAISANGSKHAVLWLLTPSSTDDHAVLEAFDPDDVNQAIYTSDDNDASESLYTKFTVPTVANGKVYIGTASGLEVFGLRGGSDAKTSPAPASATHAIASLVARPGSALHAAAGLFSSEHVKKDDLLA